MSTSSPTPRPSPRRPPALVVTFEGGGRLEHPLLPDLDICGLIGRLAPHIPSPAVWAIQPANNGKVTGDPSAPRPQGATS